MAFKCLRINGAVIVDDSGHGVWIFFRDHPGSQSKTFTKITEAERDYLTKTMDVFGFLCGAFLLLLCFLPFRAIHRHVPSVDLAPKTSIVFTQIISFSLVDLGKSSGLGTLESGLCVIWFRRSRRGGSAGEITSRGTGRYPGRDLLELSLRESPNPSTVPRCLPKNSEFFLNIDVLSPIRNRAPFTCNWVGADRA